VLKKNIFVIGGCKSGKSRHALELAEKITKEKRLFIATCVPCDNEMEQKVARHKKERDKTWSTLEIPIKISEAIQNNHNSCNVILIDCITLWINNILATTKQWDAITGNVKRFVHCIEKSKCPVIMVSNEVGTGIVPENSLARLFRDVAGYVNQQIAAHVDDVFWMVAGIPVPIKKS